MPSGNSLLEGTAAAKGLGIHLITYWGDGKKEAQELMGLPENYELPVS